jgi:uroporphyrinogen-III synthase
VTRKPATIVVTRAEGSDGPLTQLLRAAGHRVLHWQVSAVTTAADPAPLRDALRRLDDYDWIVFTSVPAVEAVLRIRTDAPARTRVAAVGNATAGALRHGGWPVDLVPAKSDAQHLAAALLAQHTGARRVLFPASAEALPTLSRQLRQAGSQVDQVEAYRLATIDGPAQTWRAALQDGAVDAITFASPSAVTRLRAALGDDHFDKLKTLVIAAIGETTATALRDNGIESPAVAPSGSLAALASTTIAALAAQQA